MSELEKYTVAISQRKAINRKATTPIVNYAIVTQLEDQDIPRLLEVIRVQDRALAEIAQNIDDSEDVDEHARIALRARLKVDELAEAGSKHQWGDVAPGNGHG